MTDLRPVYVAEDGDVKGPASASDGHLPLFNGSTGKLLKSSGAPVTAAGLALLDDNTPADQRATLQLDNVNNTSDLSKPISTAQQAALDLKADILVGEISWLATMAPPAGRLAANGGAVSRTTYANLFTALTASMTGDKTSGNAVITNVSSTPQSMWVGMPISGPGIQAGTTIVSVSAAPNTITLSLNANATSTTTGVVVAPFGVGDGSTTFNLPEGRARVARGWDNGAGVDTGRVFGSYQADGFASHNHGVTDPGHNHTFSVSNGGGGSIQITGSPSQAPGANTTAKSATDISIQYAGIAETRVKSIALLACIKY